MDPRAHLVDGEERRHDEPDRIFIGTIDMMVTTFIKTATVTFCFQIVHGSSRGFYNFARCCPVNSV